jgi:MscS family membrane protein
MLVRTATSRRNPEALCALFVAAALLAAPAARAATEGATTPRAAALAYLESCRAGDYEGAARYLDLSRVPRERRAEEGPRLARQLKVVLDRKLWVDVDALSEAPGGRTDDGLPPGMDALGGITTAAGEVRVLLERLGEPPAQEWRIAASTVSRIPALYEELGYGRLGEWLPAPLFTIRFLETELWQWIGLVLLAPLAWGLGSFATWALLGLLRRAAARGGATVQGRLLARISAPLALAIAVATYSGGSAVLGLSVPAQRLLGGLAQGLLVLAVTWIAMRAVDVIASGLEERVTARGELAARTAIQMGGRIVKALLILVASLTALQNYGFNVTGILATLGIGGIAVAFAAQRTVENFFGGVSILVDRPVEVGHFCRFGDKIGTIEEIGLRSTRVRTLDRTLVTIPNAEFSTLQIENFAARDRIRFFATIGLRYETTSDQLRWVLVKIRELLLAHPKVDPDPARIRFIGFGACSVDLEVFAFLRTSDFNEFLAIREDLLLRIMDVVEESGTGFAFPSQTVYVSRDAGLDEERSRRAETQVREWRAKGELCLPDFPPERIRRIDDTLAYPPEGSAVAR